MKKTSSQHTSKSTKLTKRQRLVRDAARARFGDKGLTDPPTTPYIKTYAKRRSEVVLGFVDAADNQLVFGSGLAGLQDADLRYMLDDYMTNRPNAYIQLRFFRRTVDVRGETSEWTRVDDPFITEIAQ